MRKRENCPLQLVSEFMDALKIEVRERELLFLLWNCCCCCLFLFSDDISFSWVLMAFQEYETALHLCEMILMYEPNNKTALEYVPDLKEKIRLKSELGYV